MVLIQNNKGRFFAGTYFGLPIWKSHHTRAMIYQTERAAQKDITFYGLENCEVSVMDEEGE